MKIGIASDHRGFNLKNELINYLNKENVVIDYGTNSTESVDYPLYANKVTKSLINKEIELGILLCGTGIGMTIAANRIKGIRCAKIDNLEEAILAKEHNDANVLAFNVNKSLDFITESIKLFNESKVLEDEKYKRRNELLDKIG
ncbi:MAG: RpiB/LacA/LacB family sugar-phosphate isomerase [Bacilli bacterium]|nr:RpiB/LacA/LacB family sugar-phosphate isomerase [Bacilli bacterium]MDD4733284.1 RpiB/LacA/LacB family sugar-phosphate isomerase [Bacilli bacterium]